MKVFTTDLHIVTVKGAHNYIVWLHPMTKWLDMKFVNTTMLTQTSWVIIVYNMSLHKGNNKIANLCMLYLSIQALHSITTLIETSHSFFA